MKRRKFNGFKPYFGVGMFEFKPEGTGADLTGTVNPVTVTLITGNDGGSATATTEFE